MLYMCPFSGQVAEVAEELWLRRRSNDFCYEEFRSHAELLELR